jgi:hypothetical protein
MNFLKKLKLVFSYGPELEKILVQKREEILAAEREKTKDYLNLCARHQQAHYGATYTEKNCDYCKLLKALKE